MSEFYDPAESAGSGKEYFFHADEFNEKAIAELGEGAGGEALESEGENFKFVGTLAKAALISILGTILIFQAATRTNGSSTVRPHAGNRDWNTLSVQSAAKERKSARSPRTDTQCRKSGSWKKKHPAKLPGLRSDDAPYAMKSANRERYPRWSISRRKNGRPRKKLPAPNQERKS